jgi:hypothetical protein
LDTARRGNAFARHHDDKRARFSRSALAPWAMARCIVPKFSTFFISTLEPHSPTRKDLTLVSRIASIPGQACRFLLR